LTACVGATATAHSEYVADLQGLIHSVEDWKDLANYGGRSVSMASTQRGNEMHIHVMAFAERADGRGVEFTRVNYKKVVELRVGANAGGAEDSAHLKSRHPFLDARELPSEARERCLDLLQRPDIAKYTIALAFQEALAEDGIILEFTEASSKE